MLESAQVHAWQVFSVTSLRSYDAHLFQKFAWLVGAYPVIHFGQFLYQFIAVTARKAARYNQLLLRFFAVNLCENRVDGFFLGGLDESAGVYQNVVCFGG